MAQNFERAEVNVLLQVEQRFVQLQPDNKTLDIREATGFKPGIDDCSFSAKSCVNELEDVASDTTSRRIIGVLEDVQGWNSWQRHL